LISGEPKESVAGLALREASEHLGIDPRWGQFAEHAAFFWWGVRPFFPGAARLAVTPRPTLPARSRSTTITVLDDDLLACARGCGNGTLPGSSPEGPPAGTVIGPAAGSTEGATTRVLLRTPQQLQAKFKHAGDFGVAGNYSKANAAEFSRAIHQHVNSPAVRVIEGTYHKQPVIHFLDPTTGLNVMADVAGNFISGWRLSAAQLQNVLTHGGL
jgi:hypothetical protein